MGIGNINGNGEGYEYPTPHQVLHPANATSISAGNTHTCAIREDGSLVCWGDDLYGQLGNGGNGYWDNSPGSQDSPPASALDLGPNRTALEVSGGYRHTCAILDTGDVKCWGYNDRGALGDGGQSGSYLYSVPSYVVDLGENRTAVSLGKGGMAEHACAILDNGDLKCWGYDGQGQLGDGGTIENSDFLSEPPSTPIDLGTGRKAVSVAVGGYHTCAILDNGDLKCWGSDGQGQLGDGGTPVNRATPVSVDLGPGRTAVAVSAGSYHTCAILDTGDVKCWGDRSLGLGLYNPSISIDTSAPSHAVLLGTGRTAVAIAAGISATCAILDDGSMRCWGAVKEGLLGADVYRLDVFWNNVPHNLGGRSSSWPILVDDHTVWDLGGAGMAGYWGIIEGIGRAWDTSALPLTTRSLNFSLVSLADSDGDGLPDELPADYDPAEGPTPGLVADDDDDDDGFSDLDELAMGTDSKSPDRRIVPSVDGADLIIGEAMDDITFQYDSSAASGSGSGMTSVTGATCTVTPALPTGLSIDSGTCTISGTPTVETSNTSYTVTAVIDDEFYRCLLYTSDAADE